MLIRHYSYLIYYKLRHFLIDHQDFDYPVMDDGVTFQLAQEPYVRRMEELKYQYKDKIDIRIGVELGLMAHIKDKTEAYAKAYDYDFIIGSSHMVNGVDPYYPAYYADKNEYQAYEQYFLSILDNVKAYDNSDNAFAIDGTIIPNATILLLLSLTAQMYFRFTKGM